MTELYEYVVIRLSPDVMRGETINVGIAVFPKESPAFVRIAASQAKVKALDPRWDTRREKQLKSEVESLVLRPGTTESKINLLASLGLCIPGVPGFFYASASDLEAELRQVAQQYISTRRERGAGTRRSKLHHEMLVKFRSMHMLGTGEVDLGLHRVVPHLPIPGSPDLKADFVYKNGVYRITQTLDYRVSPMGARQKVSEACTKVMAATAGVKVWGDDTKKFALVNVPADVAPIADSHLDMLYAAGFEIFHADNHRELEQYEKVAFSH